MDDSLLKILFQIIHCVGQLRQNTRIFCQEKCFMYIVYDAFEGNRKREFLSTREPFLYEHEFVLCYFVQCLQVFGAYLREIVLIIKHSLANGRGTLYMPSIFRKPCKYT